MFRDEAGLYGLKNSNRNFKSKDAWGKNQFNSSFPAALCCYMESKAIKAKYLKIHNGEPFVDEVEIKDIFGANHDQIQFDFESQYSPFEKYFSDPDSFPRTDLVTKNKENMDFLCDLEMKLSVLPDSTTSGLDDSQYGCEIVVRPTTIAYLACNLHRGLKNKDIISTIEIDDWTNTELVLKNIDNIRNNILNISNEIESNQKTFLIQPIWKTKIVGENQWKLHENAYDVFGWSDACFARLIYDISGGVEKEITRPVRTIIWLYKMLLEIKEKGSFNYSKIIDDLSYGTKNDKAFAVAGYVTNKYMRCERLTNPIIKSTETNNIILGSGEKFLQPERRLDAIIANSNGLFNKKHNDSQQMFDFMKLNN